MFVLSLPWVLLCLPLPFLLWRFLPPAATQVSVALKVPFFQDLQQMMTQEQTRFGQRGMLLGLSLAWIFLIIALTGPKWVGPPQPLHRESYNIILALDISPSMGVNDMQDNHQRVTRLFAVKQAAKQFVKQRVGDKIGLILFGEQAYLLTPLTFDRHNVIQRLEDASVGLAGKSTSIGDALGLAIKRLQQVPDQGRMIVLLTDGVSNSGVLTPAKAAELARNEHIQINTIGLHSAVDPRSFDGLFFNMVGGAELDEDALKAVAERTGGHYFRATDPASLARIYGYIDKMTRVSQDQAAVRPQYEYYPWFLGVGMLILLSILGLQGRVVALKRGLENG